MESEKRTAPSTSHTTVSCSESDKGRERECQSNDWLLSRNFVDETQANDHMLELSSEWGFSYDSSGKCGVKRYYRCKAVPSRTISTEAVLYHTGDGHGSPLPHNCHEILKKIGKKRHGIVPFVKDQILYIYNKLHITRTKLIKAKLIDMKAAARNEEKEMFILPTDLQIKTFIGNYVKKSAQPFDYGALYAALLEKSKEVEGDSNTNRHLYQATQQERAETVTLPKSLKRKSFCQDQDQEANLIVPDKRRKSLQGERIAESQFKPNEDFNQTISFGSAIKTLRGRKPRRVAIDQENVNYENFSQSIPNSFNGKFTSTTRKEKRGFDCAKKTAFGDVTNGREAKKRNLNRVIMGLKEAGAGGDSECCPIQRQMARVVKRKDLDSVIAGLWLAREVGK